MRDIAASVRARLLNHARAERLKLQSVLTRYGVERILVHLSISAHVDRFILKGAQLLLVRAAEPHRPSKDLDPLGIGNEDAAELAQVFREVGAVPDAPDGLDFDAVTLEDIPETARYGGVRVKLAATLERARVPLQVDVAFGDVVTPATVRITFRSSSAGRPRRSKATHSRPAGTHGPRRRPADEAALSRSRVTSSSPAAPPATHNRPRRHAAPTSRAATPGQVTTMDTRPRGSVTGEARRY